MDSKLIASLLKGQINEKEIKELERQLFEEYGTIASSTLLDRMEKQDNPPFEIDIN